MLSRHFCSITQSETYSSSSSCIRAVGGAAATEKSLRTHWRNYRLLWMCNHTALQPIVWWLWLSVWRWMCDNRKTNFCSSSESSTLRSSRQPTRESPRVLKESLGDTKLMANCCLTPEQEKSDLPQTVSNGCQQQLINLQLRSAALRQVEPSISRGLEGPRSASRCCF